MLLKTALPGLCLLLALTSIAQTNIIRHKSHSGSMASFYSAVEPEATETPDFGRGPEEYVRTAALDSVIFISDSVSVMITSNYCNRPRNGTTNKWSAGKDTIINHPLFSHQHSLDSIKKVLFSHYYFVNPVDSVRFIGFDNEVCPPPKKVKYLGLGFATTNDDNGTGTPPVLFISLIALSVGLITGLLAWKASRTVAS
jgi:hypothetical protein